MTNKLIKPLKECNGFQKYQSVDELQNMLLELNLHNMELEMQNHALKEVNKELLEANKTKDKFLSIIAHDLIGPMGSIDTFIELIMSEPFDNTEMTMYFECLRTLSKSTFSLVRNLLNWVRVQKDHIKAIPEKIKLKNVVQEVLLLVKFDAENKRINLKIDIEDGIWVYADKEMLKTVLRNLLANAIKFTPLSGEVIVSAFVDTHNYAEISISDNGIGIDEEQLKQIFNNRCVSTYGTNSEKGYGIGLSLCQEFISKNGGALRVKSEVGKGSEFIFTVPFL